MNKARLLKLADFLETVPRKAFDIGKWVKSEKSKPEGKRAGSCGFAGCAVGWAAHAKLFRGLKLERSVMGTLYPAYNGASSTEAINSLFQIGDDDATRLFFECAYREENFQPSPKQVAKRIRAFVKDAS